MVATRALRAPCAKAPRKSITILAGLVDPDHRKEVGLLLHNEGRKERVWHPVNPLRSLLVLPCPDLMVNGQMQQPCPEKGRMNRGIRPLGDVGLSHATETGRFRFRTRLIYNEYRRGKMSICCSSKPAIAAGAIACALTMSSRLSPQEGSPLES